MWDLATLERENNTHALYEMMGGFAVEEAQAPLPSAWALTVLADRMTAGPPSLAAMMACLEHADVAKDFRSLVQLILPEYEQEIMWEPMNRRVYRFCYCFGKKYYPLPANTNCPVGSWLDGMPVQLLGLAYTAYHDLDFRPGYALLLSLVAYPFEGIENDFEDDEIPFDPGMDTKGDNYKPLRDDVKWLRTLVANLAIDGKWIAPMGFTIEKVGLNKIKLIGAKNTKEVKDTIKRTLMVAEKAKIETIYHRGRSKKDKQEAGARIPLLEKVKQLVGPELAERVPPCGWLPEQLHKTDGTKIDGLGVFADWAFQKTGCVMLDTTPSNCEWVEGSTEPAFKWTVRNVQILSQQWPKVVEIRKKIDHLVQWLEEDPQRRFAEILDFLLVKNDLGTGEKNREYDPSDHFCQLDLHNDFNGEEDDNDDE
jgi:hypothetical protein